MINIFDCTCPNRLEDGTIDESDRFEQAFDTYYIPEASKKIFMDDIQMVRLQKTHVFGGYKAFTSTFTYYNLYSTKLKVITWKKYALRFSIRPIHLSLKTSEDLDLKL